MVLVDQDFKLEAHHSLIQTMVAPNLHLDLVRAIRLPGRSSAAPLVEEQMVKLSELNSEDAFRYGIRSEFSDA